MNDITMTCSYERYLTAMTVTMLILSCLTMSINTSAGAQLPSEAIHGRTVQVPVDHDDPDSGLFPLYYEFGAPFDPDKPTVFIVTDAQQFYVQKGTVSRIQNQVFGPEFNVVGIPGRSSSDEILSSVVGEDGEVDWQQAYRLLRSAQWIEDIEDVRRDFSGPDTAFMLYGRSGGAHLMHEYLVKYGENVKRAFSQAACNPFLEAEFGLQSDQFWNEIGTFDAMLQEKLLQVMARNTSERTAIVQLFQRQNFFVPRSEIGAARAALINDLYNGNQKRIAELKEIYQVDAIQTILKTPRGIGIRVRLYEFFEPIRYRGSVFDDAVHPDIENTSHIAQPLLQLRESGKLPATGMDFGALHKLQTEVFILAGRWDHTCDYRSQIALSSHYSPRIVFLADDGHMFDSFNQSHIYPSLVQTFLHHGVSSDELMDVLGKMDHLRWREN